MTDYPPLEQLAAEEAELVLPRLTNDDGIALGLALLEAARADALPVVVDVRRGDQVLFHAALAGTAATNDAWVERKVRVVRLVGTSSLRAGAEAAASGSTFEARQRVDPLLYAAHGGAFPLVVRGAGLVGVVTVSGLPQVEDHRLVVRVLREFLASSGAGKPM
jgi:uncharacterized protein (UPF0303 family)